MLVILWVIDLSMVIMLVLVGGLILGLLSPTINLSCILGKNSSVLAV